jgi:hypothetical protein
MLFRSLASLAFLATFFPLSSTPGAAQAPTPVCKPTVTAPIIVATHDQIIEAGRKAEPPLINTKGFGFAWPDTQMGVIKTADGTSGLPAMVHFIRGRSGKGNGLATTIMDR